MQNDARVHYTRLRLRQAFLDCLAEQPVSRITVKSLCERAGINRATFYRHYADPFDLLDKLETEALEELRAIIESHRSRPQRDMLLALLHRLCDRSSDWVVLFSANGESGLAMRVCELLYQEFQPRLAQQLPWRSAWEQDAAYLFAAGGSGYLLARWVSSGMDASSEAMADAMLALSSAMLQGYGGK